MTSSQLKEILKTNILTLAAPDVSSPELLMDYVQAGADVLLAPACLYMNEEEADALAVLQEAADDQAFVAGHLSAPEEALEENGGSLSYDTYYNSVLKRTEWLDDMGVSMIFLTGFSDVITAKCAVYAIREAAFDMPICIGMKLSEDNESIKRALSMLISLQPLGICAAGCTDMDIEDALHILSELQAFTTVPLFSLCHPGHFLEPETYGEYIPSLIRQKCAILGMQASAPAFAAAAVKESWQFDPLRPDFPVLNAACSQNEVLFLDFSGKIVGHNKQLLEIKTEKEEELKQALTLFNRPGAAPVCFNIRDIDLLEYAIRHYNGRPAVRSDEYGEITAKELGAFVLSDEQPTNQ